MDWVSLTHKPIDADKLVRAIATHAAGAVATFLGTVRAEQYGDAINQSRDRKGAVGAPVEGSSEIDGPTPIAKFDPPATAHAHPLTVGALTDEANASLAVGALTGQALTGRHTKTLVALDYEAYDVMALLQMTEIRGRAIAELGILDAAVVHRLGRIPLGEASIAVVVASAHRAEAFDACRWIVDQVKLDVPIWKKDVWSDGTTPWVDPLA